MEKWASEEEREAHYRELMTHGEAMRSVNEQGELTHVPRCKWRVDEKPPAQTTPGESPNDRG